MRGWQGWDWEGDRRMTPNSESEWITQEIKTRGHSFSIRVLSQGGVMPSSINSQQYESYFRAISQRCQKNPTRINFSAPTVLRRMSSKLYLLSASTAALAIAILIGLHIELQSSLQHSSMIPLEAPWDYVRSLFARNP